MIEGITQTEMIQKLDPDYKAAILKAWDELRESQREMFHKVAIIYATREDAHPDDLQSWVSRYDIAAASGKARLNDAENKRLEDLVMEGFLWGKSRSNGHIDESGRFRPHNSSLVYRPNEDVQLILTERVKRRIEAQRVLELSAPRKPISAEKPFKPYHQQELYEHFGMPAPIIRSAVETRLTVYDHISFFWGELAEGFKILLTNRFFLAGIALLIIVIIAFILIGL